jgi:hypothetical protein
LSSFARRIRRRRERPPQLVAYLTDRLAAREATLAAARASGCTCQPEIELDWPRVYCRHDDWCALLRCEDVN